MNKKDLSETDIRTKFITPAINPRKKIRQICPIRGKKMKYQPK